MKKFFFVVLIPIILFSCNAIAKTMYVTDTLYIMARRQPGLDYKIVDQLASNEQVNLLQTDESWAQISFKDNKTGWVLQRFLTEEIPKSVQIEQLKQTLDAQSETIESLEKENAGLKVSKAEMVDEVSALKIENQKMKEEPYRIILLLAGGGIFLFGSMLTLIIQGSARRRKKSSLSF